MVSSTQEKKNDFLKLSSLKKQEAADCSRPKITQHKNNVQLVPPTRTGRPMATFILLETKSVIAKNQHKNESVSIPGVEPHG